MKLILNIIAPASGILLSFPTAAWNLPVGEFKFEPVADQVYVMHGPLAQPNRDNQGFMIKALEYVAAGNFEHVVPGHGPSGNIETTVIPYLNYLKAPEVVVAEGLEAEPGDYEIKANVLQQLEYISHSSEFDSQFGLNLNKMYL